MNYMIDDIRTETGIKAGKARTAETSDELTSLVGLGTNMTVIWAAMDRAKELYLAGNPQGQEYLVHAVNSPYRSVFEMGCRTLEILGYNHRDISRLYSDDFIKLDSHHFVRRYFETGIFAVKE